jgi:3-hydroxyacyl-CoA dehydrogenase
MTVAVTAASSHAFRLMRIAKLGVVGAGTMGSGIAALAASAGIPVVLLDIPGPEGDRNAPARTGLERARKARPAAFMDVARAGLVTTATSTTRSRSSATAT